MSQKLLEWLAKSKELNVQSKVIHWSVSWLFIAQNFRNYLSIKIGKGLYRKSRFSDSYDTFSLNIKYKKNTPRPPTLEKEL